MHVLSPPTKLPAGEPDLRPSTLPTVPYNSDVLKNNVERVYSTAGVWGIYASREMLRLMSWKPADRKRTGYFCAVSPRSQGCSSEAELIAELLRQAYFIAWWFSLVIPLIVGLLVSDIILSVSLELTSATIDHSHRPHAVSQVPLPSRPSSSRPSCLRYGPHQPPR